MTYVQRCEHCECKMLPYGTRVSGKSSKLVHYGSLTACGIIQATRGAIRLRIAERDEARQRAADFEKDIACLEERAKETAAELASAVAALRLYRIKFASSDMGGWDAGAHLAAKDAFLADGRARHQFRGGRSDSEGSPMTPAATFAKAILNLDHFEDQQDAVLDIVHQAMLHGRHEANAQYPLLFILALRISNRVCEETASGGMRCTSSNPSNPGAWCDPCYAFNALNGAIP